MGLRRFGRADFKPKVPAVHVRWAWFAINTVAISERVLSCRAYLLRCELKEAPAPECQVRCVGKALLRGGGADRPALLQQCNCASQAPLDDVTVHRPAHRFPERQLQIGDAGSRHLRQLRHGEARILQASKGFEVGVRHRF